MAEEAFKRCATCMHGKPSPDGNMAWRQCREGPPQPVLLPVGPGRFEIKWHFPVIVKEETCDRWKSKLILETMSETSGKA